MCLTLLSTRNLLCNHGYVSDRATSTNIKKCRIKPALPFALTAPFLLYTPQTSSEVLRIDPYSLFLSLLYLCTLSLHLSLVCPRHISVTTLPGMVLSSQDNLAIVAATYNAIETAPLKVLRQILLEACESSPIVQQIVSKRLLLRWKEVKELGYEINQHGVFPLTPETTIERFPLYESDEQDEDEGEGCLSTMQRYEACRACKKKFDVCHNLPGSNDACMTHQGTRLTPRIHLSETNKYREPGSLL